MKYEWREDEIISKLTNPYNIDEPKSLLNWDEKFFLTKLIHTPDGLELAYYKLREPELRLIIIDKIYDQELLEDIVKNEVDPILRKLALKKLPNSFHELFIDCIRNDKNWGIRYEAASKLPSRYQDIYVLILINEPHHRVRMKIKEKIRLPSLTQDQLTLLAINAYDSMVRKASIRYINLEDKLFEISINCSDYKIAEIAVDKLDNQELLKRIAILSEYAHIRAKSAMKIMDEHFLAKLFIDDDSPFVKEVTIDRIYNKNILAMLRFTADPMLQPSILSKLKKVLDRN